MWRLQTLVSFLCISSNVNAGSHSLYAFATFIIGETQFPQFSVVLLLDDVQVAYYDSTERKVIHRRHNNTEDYDAEQRYLGLIFEDIYDGMKHRALYMKHQYNATHGVHAQQRLAGCDFYESDNSGKMMLWDTFNGIKIDELHFNTQQFSYEVNSKWSDIFSINKVQFQQLFSNIYYPICIRTLRKYLLMEKNSVRRKVKPRVRILKKTLTDSGMVQVSCLATGFYPRHINLTILRDGQPVFEDQITGGILLPNTDGTYQMRKSLEISEEELREKHKYTCTATHLSLDNKLDIHTDNSPDPLILPLMISILVVLFVLVMAPITGCIIWKRCTGRKQLTQGGYAATANAEENGPSADFK
ncbi:class I histocompatibility antigen, F10 alpha chain-like [Chanos chanos]|uniref:Class I histocompatibility antigen, F10 alpha chain-like n=1 Tax=Chanos chanos TaxID=29144 RepID=A0A6J2UQV7_CHACN|nr:class I histocompatibility antigen, F10 alpha chain-like [Chanos chanos]